MGVMKLDEASGLGGLLKDGTTLAEGVDEAVLRNIAAVKQLADVVRTSLGPNGMKKLIINHLGKTLVSSDCATITRELEVVHPAAQMVALAAKAQESEMGDGTNLVVSFAGELLALAEELLRLGLHTSEVVAGYEVAYEECRRLVETSAARSTAADAREVEAIAETVVRPVVAAKHEGLESELALLVARACATVMKPRPEPPVFKVDQVRVAKIRGGDFAASTVCKGLLIMRDAETSVKTATNAKVAVFNCAIEVASTETKGTVLIRTADELLNYNKTEERALERAVAEIAAAGVGLVVSNGSISEMARHFLEKFGLMALRVPSKFDVRRLCQATGATALVRLGAPTPEELGRVARARVVEIAGRTCCVLDQDADTTSKIATVVLRAATTSLLDDLERAVDNGVYAVRAVAKDPRLVYGAGAFEAAMASKLRAFARDQNGLEQYAAFKFAEAFECVPRALAENAGRDATEVVAALRSRHDEAAGDAAWADAGVYDDDDDDASGGDADASRLLEGGTPRDGDAARAPSKKHMVYDSLAVKESAIRLAVDAALTVLRVDQIIMSKPAGGPKMPKQGPPDA